MSRRLISCEPEFESVGLFVFGIGVLEKNMGRKYLNVLSLCWS